MVDLVKKASLVNDAASKLREHIEELLQDVVLEIPRKHHPVRRALALYAPIESSMGERCPFSLYKQVLDDIESGKQHIAGIQFEFEADPENDGFANQIKSLTEGGMSDEEAIAGLSGGFNLETLAEGMIPAFEKLIRDILPVDQIGEGFSEAAGPISDYMGAGLSPDAQAGTDIMQFTQDIKERAKSIAKASVGIRTSHNKELDASPKKIASYLVSVGLRKTAEFSPAKIWHAWALYPELRRIELDSRAAISSPPSDKPMISYRTSGGRVNSTEAQHERKLNHYARALREMAIIMSSVLSNSNICCIVAAFLEIPNGKAILSSLRGMLGVMVRLNQFTITKEIPEFTDGPKKIKERITAEALRRIDRRLQESRDYLRRNYELLTKSLGEDTTECGGLEELFQTLLQVLAKVRVKAVGMLRNLSRSVTITRTSNQKVHLTIAENAFSTQTLYMLERIHNLLENAERCGLEEEGRDERARALITRLQQDQRAFKIHKKGEPLPAGLDPEHPFANLEPLETEHGILVEPGIQGVNIPTGELEELFDACKGGDLTQFSNWKTLKQMIKRR